MTGDINAWMIALSAPIRRRARFPLTGLAGGFAPAGGRGNPYCVDQLTDIPSVRSRAELLELLRRHLDEGTRAEYAEYRRWHDELPPEARSCGFFLLDQSVRLKRVFVHDHAGRPEETSVAGWDVARIVHYAGLGWGAGYLTEAEAWRVIAQAARIALTTYASWAEYGRGLLYGRWFEVGYWDDAMTETRAAVDSVAEQVWANLPWPVDLSAVDDLARTPDPAPDSGRPTALTCTAVRMFVDCPGCQVPILVREVAATVTCESCGETSMKAAQDAWKHATSCHQSDDEDEDEFYGDDGYEYDAEGKERPDKDAGDNETGKVDGESAKDRLTLHTNLDDHIQRTLVRINAALMCAGCGDTIHNRSDGPYQCACGHVTRFVPAPAWLQKIDASIRLVVGGPLTFGQPDGVLHLLTDKELP